MTPLIDEMRAQIHATPMVTTPARSWWWRRRTTGLLSGGALALAGIAVAVVLLVGGGSSVPPAYAAVLRTVGGRRTVSLTLHEERDIPALNARLAAEHTRIRVVPVVKGCDDPVHSVSNGEVVPGPAKTLLSTPTYQDGRLLSVGGLTISVNTIAGRTLVVPVVSDGFYAFGGSVVVGPAPSCVGIGPRDNVTPS